MGKVVSVFVAEVASGFLFQNVGIDKGDIPDLAKVSEGGEEKCAALGLSLENRCCLTAVWCLKQRMKYRASLCLCFVTLRVFVVVFVVFMHWNLARNPTDPIIYWDVTPVDHADLLRGVLCFNHSISYVFSVTAPTLMPAFGDCTQTHLPFDLTDCVDKQRLTFKADLWGLCCCRVFLVFFQQSLVEVRLLCCMCSACDWLLILQKTSVDAVFVFSHNSFSLVLLLSLPSSFL